MNYTLTITDALTVINGNLPDATEHGHPDAVADLTAAVDELQASLAPLVEVLSQPENREHFRMHCAWLESHTHDKGGALRDLYNALEAL